MWILTLMGCATVLAGLPGESAYLTGCDAYRAEKYDQALRAFEVSGNADSDLAPWAAVRIGMCLDAQKRPDDAQTVFEQVIAGPPGPWKAMARGHLANLSKEREDNGAIVAQLKGFEEVTPLPWWMDSYVWQFSESVLNQPGDRTAGYTFFRDTVEKTWYIQPRLDSARFLVKSPSPRDQAVALLGLLRSSAYSDIQKLLPTLTVSLADENGQDVRLADLAAWLLDTDPGNDGQAMAVIRRHISHEGARFALAYAARILASRKDFARAESLCYTLVDLDPKSREAGESLWSLGGALERAGKIVDAERVYEALPAKCKDHFRADDALNRLGELYLEKGNPEKGLGFLIRLGREYPDSRFRPGAYYRCANHPSIRKDADMRRLYLASAAADGIGYYYAHRALERLFEVDQPADKPPVNLRVDGANPVLLPYPDKVEPIPPLPEIITRSTEYQRLTFFARHGLEESEWEVLPLLLSLKQVESKEPYYRAFAEAGLAHTALQFADYEGWGVGKDGKRSLARLRLEYPLAYWPEVKELAGQVGLDPYLILAVARQESTFRPNLTSHAGASGVMQLMPGTAKWLAKVDPNIETEHVDNLESPVNSLRLGTYYLLRMFERSNGNLVDTLASYNGGPGNRDKWRKLFPNYDLDQFVEAIPFEETKNYVQKVLGNYAAYRTLYPPVQ